MSAVLHDEDAVRMHDSREPVRNDERGAALRHPVERVLDFLLGVAVKRARRLVED